VRHFRSFTFEVTVGGIDRTKTETGERTLTSRIAYPHEKYNQNTLVNDVAVVKLPSAFTLSKFCSSLINRVLTANNAINRYGVSINF
jgi:secreted trypsin-like serine protease